MNNIKTILRESWIITYRDFAKRKWWKDLLSLVYIIIIMMLLAEGFNFIMNTSVVESNPKQFITGGFLGYFIVVLAMTAGTSLVFDKKGFNKILLIAPISRISILIGKAIYLLLTAIIYIVFIAAIMMMYTHTFSLINILLLIIITTTSLLSVLGVTFLICAFVENETTIQTITKISTIIVFLFSGVFYSISKFPKAIQPIFYINPATYIIDAVRYSFSGQHIFSITILFTILLISAIIFPALGSYFYIKKMRE